MWPQHQQAYDEYKRASAKLNASIAKAKKKRKRRKPTGVVDSAWVEWKAEKMRAKAARRNANRTPEQVAARTQSRNRLSQMRRVGLWPKPEYYRYIGSRFWRELRDSFIADAGGRCERCGCGGVMHIHHRHYRTLGNEARCDVEVICVGCHTAEHEEDGVELSDDVSRQFRAIIG